MERVGRDCTRDLNTHLTKMMFRIILKAECWRKQTELSTLRGNERGLRAYEEASASERVL